MVVLFFTKKQLHTIKKETTNDIRMTKFLNIIKNPSQSLSKFWVYLKKPNVHYPLFFLLIFAVSYPSFGFEARIAIFTFTALSLFYFHVPLRFWIYFLSIFSIFYGQFYYDLFDHNWPDQFKHLWLITYGLVIYYTFVILRTYLISLPIVKILKAFNFAPQISQTEREALDAGVTWVDKEYFRGRPNFKRLFSQPFPRLTKKEQSFVNNELQGVCHIANEWEIIRKKQFPEEVEQKLRDGKFFGMIIPEEYDGLGFSPLGNARVIERLSSVNFPIAVLTMVPNSLGPAELLLQYGTEKQKEKYLKSLAVGKDLPCFGLTEPQAGSDASSINSHGVLFKGDDGRIKIRMNWNKRWITLSAKATVLGVAIQLEDPEGLYSDKKQVGITCVLVPADTPGVKRGLYHDPMGIPFYNAPMQGVDVVVDAEEAIIGGLKQAGQGWKMLMECLVAGRGISLPALAVGSSKRISWIVKHHSSIRKQFGLPLAKFEGVQEPLTRIAAFTNLISACQNYTLSALNQGIDAPIVTAISKHYTTEFARKISTDGMDIMGGAGLTLGPKNMIGNLYRALPIAITVEGANIITRTLIIYGQGSLRNHPFAYSEIKAIESGDFELFDKVFWQHFYQIVCNNVRTFIMCATRGYSHISPSYLGRGHRYIQKIAWSSAIFSWLTNQAIFFLGAKLKFKEQITGRFADVLSYQYIATALLWQWKSQGSNPKHWPVVRWGLDYCFYEIQKSIENLLLNFRFPLPFIPVQKILFFALRLNSIGSAPKDKISKQVVDAFLNDEECFNNLVDNLYIPKDKNNHMAKMLETYKIVKQSEATGQKIKQAIKQKKLPKKRIPYVMDEALQAGIINQEEFNSLKNAERARFETIQVDAFPWDEYIGKQ